MKQITVWRTYFCTKILNHHNGSLFRKITLSTTIPLIQRHPEISWLMQYNASLRTRSLTLNCNILFNYVDLPLRSTFMPCMCNVGWYSLAVFSLLSIHVSAQSAIVRCASRCDEDSAARCNAVLLFLCNYVTCSDNEGTTREHWSTMHTDGKNLEHKELNYVHTKRNLFYHYDFCISNTQNVDIS